LPQPGQFEQPGQYAPGGQFQPPGQQAQPGQFPPGQYQPPGQYSQQGQYQPPGQYPPGGYVPPGGAGPGAGAPQPPRRRRRGMIIAAACVFALLVGGGATFAVVKMRDTFGGAATPEAAATKFVEAAASIDVVELFGSLAPSERNVFAQVTEAWQQNSDKGGKELKDLYNKVKEGWQAKVENLTLDSQDLVDGVNRVAITGGTITIKADSAQIAEAAMDLMDQMSEASSLLGESPDYNQGEIEDMIDQGLAEPLDLAELTGPDGDAGFVVVVQEDGKWFTSLSMTAAQYGWESSGNDNADLSNPIPSDQMAQYSSPEAAATGFFEALDEFMSTPDPATLAKSLPPAESRLVAVYGPALFGGAEPVDGLTIGQTGFSKAGEFAGLTNLTVDQFGISFDDSLSEFSLDWSRDGEAFTLQFASSDLGSLDVEFDGSQDNTWAVDFSFTGASYGYGDEADLPTEVMGEATLSLPKAGVIELTGDISVPESTYEESEEGGASINTIMTSEASLKATIEGDMIDMELTMDGETSTETQEVPGLGDSLKSVTELPKLSKIFTVTAVKSNGSWYLSPTASLFGLVAAAR
jgi:hypothetical protein